MTNSNNYVDKINNYLTKERCISPEVVTFLEEKKLISYHEDPVLFAKIVMRDLD
jgi:hypothetical protein